MRVVQGQLDDVLGVVADALDVDHHADQHETGVEVLVSGQRQVREDLAAHLALVGVDQLVLGVDVDLQSRIVPLAQRLDGGQEHLPILSQHLARAFERLAELALPAEQIEDLFQHDFTSATR